MFETAPSWTVPIANLTQWFDWEALGAIGTVGALWLAVIQVFRNARFERLRAASTLARLGELIGPIAELSAHDEDGNLVSDNFGYLLNDGLLDRAIRGLETISVEHVPDTTVANYVQALPRVLERYKESISGLTAELLPPLYHEEASYVVEAEAYFSLLKQVYLRNSWKARRLLAKNYWLAG